AASFVVPQSNGVTWYAVLAYTTGTHMARQSLSRCKTKQELQSLKRPQSDATPRVAGGRILKEGQI
ncbi:hypothetical protein LJC48_05185, partial [Desulfovibrio sp. OttesenSCG-928-C06]|nr:hypothetical protein [Desulfovibrio sp. OttesenSCG-928-C06]